MSDNQKQKQNRTAKKKPGKALKSGKGKAPAKKEASNLGQEAVKTKHAGGRPPKYRTAQALQEKITAYFDSCWIDKVTEVTDKEGNCTMSTVRYQARPYTVMGLAIALDLTRQGLCEYAAKGGELSDAVKKAKQIVEMNVEEALLEGKNAAGPIFWLKNNSSYRDKQEFEHTGTDGGPIVHKITDLTRDDLIAIASGGRPRNPKKG